MASPRKRAPALEPVRPQQRVEPILTYGLTGLDPATAREKLGANAQLIFDQAAFASRLPVDRGCPPRHVLFRRIADKLLPGYFEWHRWTDRVVETMCNHRWIGVTGCSGSAKTHNITGFACAWWLCNPAESSVILCSTTAKALRRRGWANVQSCFTTIPGTRVGNFVDSRMLWQVDKGDDKHAIMGLAVEEGGTQRVADNIKAVHTKRQLVIIDEATSVPRAIFEACTNLWTYPIQSGGEFILVMIGNAISWLDEFGKFIEPAEGITSVSLDDEEWETKPQLDGNRGICIRFDVEKSPNLDVPEDKPVSKHLPNAARLRMLENNPGYRNSPTYWSNERGFPPPETISKKVFSESALTACKAYDKHAFTGENFTIIGAFDPARAGGDLPCLRFGALGMTDFGYMGLEWMPPIIIPVDARSSNPIDYQIYEQVRRECERVKYRGTTTFCLPENLGIDATGGGADLCDIFNRMWSLDIIRIVFSAAASPEPASHEDVRPCNEVYLNLRAEMYFRTRDGLDSGQIKGIDKESALEMVTIDYDDSKKKRAIIAKKDYKKVYGKSPDKTDSGIMLTQVARRRGFRVAPRGAVLQRYAVPDTNFKAAQEVFSTVDYSPDEEYEPVDEM